jgi:hypothetical protein
MASELVNCVIHGSSQLSALLPAHERLLQIVEPVTELVAAFEFAVVIGLD